MQIKSLIRKVIIGSCMLGVTAFAAAPAANQLQPEVLKSGALGASASNPSTIAQPAIPAQPSVLPKPSAPTLPTVAPAPPEIDARGYILLDADTGYVIAAKSPDEKMPPASLTKLMTMYVISGFIKSGRLNLTDQVTVSENAWRTGGSRMFIKVGTQVPVSDLINGIVVASGNDACVAMSEHLAGTEKTFVDMMNKSAAELGMKNTHYADATGLPDPTNYTTPADLSLLVRSIIQNYPEDYKWYSQKWMTYNNIRQPNRNLLLWRDPTVDGLKTGHTDDAGYCLAASAKRNDTRLVAIIMGAASTKLRAQYAQALFNYGFNFYQTQQLYPANATLTTLRVPHGVNKQTAFGVLHPMVVTVPKGQHDQVKAMLGMQQPLKAPIVKGKSYGTVQVMLNNQIIASQPVVAFADNPDGIIS